jgi:hypothetical protein
LLLLRAEDRAVENGVDLRRSRGLRSLLQRKVKGKTDEHSQDVLPSLDEVLDAPKDFDSGAGGVEKTDDGLAVVAVGERPRHLQAVEKECQQKSRKGRKKGGRTFSRRVTMLKYGRSATFFA